MNPSYNSGGLGNAGISGAGSVGGGSVGGGIYSSGVTPPANPGATGISGTSGAPIVSPPVMKIGNSSRKPRKGMIIGAVLLILALVLGILAVVMMPKGGGQKTTANNTTFNKLINYVVSGEESTAAFVGEFNYSDDYYFLGIVNEGDNTATTELYNTTKKLLDDFVEKYNKDDKNLDMVVIPVKNLFDFMEVIYYKKMINISNLLADWSTGGNDVAKQNAMGYYGFATDTNNAYINGFLIGYETWVDAVLEEIKFYSDISCISVNKLDYDCAVSKDAAGTAEKLEKMNSSYDEIYDYFHLGEKFVAGIFSINDVLNGNSMTGGDNA